MNFSSESENYIFIAQKIIASSVIQTDRGSESNTIKVAFKLDFFKGIYFFFFDRNYPVKSLFPISGQSKLKFDKCPNKSNGFLSIRIALRF